MENAKVSDRLDTLRAALNRKIDEATALGKTIDRDKCAVFYTSAARLLEEIEGGESREIVDFRKLDGTSSFIHEDPRINEERDNKMYYSDLKQAKAILQAVKESFAWRTRYIPVQADDTTVNNDAVKQAVLDLLYTAQRQHPNRSKGLSAKYLMSRLTQYPRGDVRLAIDFLKGERWLSIKAESGVERYRLSSTAINKYHPSAFKGAPYSAVQITGSNNLVVLGDNVGSISQDNRQGIHDIDTLMQLVKELAEVSVDQKVGVVSDLETIKAQLLKKQPDAGIINLAWTGVKNTLGTAATIAGVADFVTIVSHFLAPFIK